GRSRLRDLLLRVDERERLHGRGNAPVGYGDLELRSLTRELDGHPRVADVPLQPRGPRGAGDPSDALAVDEDRAEVRDCALLGERVAADADADELAVDALVADPAERLLSDEVVGLVELHEPFEAGDVERRVLHPHIGAVVEDTGLDAARLRRRDRADAVRLSCLHHTV